MENVNPEEGRRLIIEEGNRWVVDRRRAKQKEGVRQPVGVIQNISI